MSSKKKKETTPVVEQVITEEPTPVVETVEIVEETPIKPDPEVKKPIKKAKIEPKCPVGSIVFISKDADADLNGFKLFPQYKKYTYTVEAYDADTDVYTLRRLNLSLRLKSEFILAPHEKADSPLARKQF